jgi:hypothetical protein
MAFFYISHQGMTSELPTADHNQIKTHEIAIILANRPKEGNSMSVPRSEPNSIRIYRLKPYFFVVSFIQAGAAIFLGGCLVWEQSRKELQGNVADGMFGIGLFFVAAFLIAEARKSAIIFEQGSISVRHFWGTSSRAKDEILGVKTTWRSGIAYTVLVPKRSTDKDLEIERSAYPFDEEWAGWISSLPDLDKAQCWK